MTATIGERQPLLSPQAHDTDTEVYPIIQVIRSVNTPLTYDALTAPDLTYTLVRPLEEKYNAYQHSGNLSVVFCLLLNRVYFYRDNRIATAALSRTRAMLCEILAIRCLREHAHNMLELALAITTSWPVYSGAPPGLLERAREQRDDDLEERVGNAIELAILGQAKRFTSSSACQKVINGIWSGKIVYQADSSRSILSDTYKRTPIHFYDPHKAPLLDHYRLKVPAIRSVLEFTNFLVLFILFIFALEFNERDYINVPEAIFMVYALGFTLEKVAAMQEHGMKVYFKGTWNGFDLAFITLYCTYAILRLVGVYHHKPRASLAGVDFLAVIAVLMFPRLAFVTLKNNVMVLSLRAMIVQFVALMLIAVFCFGGFLYALWTLSRNQAGYVACHIAWWMLDLWFGLDASGFDNASEFHPVFGPVMLVSYACLSNTLLLTGACSNNILSNTFATINDDAAAEAMFRRAVLTIEGVKADPLFSYQPPINLVALCIMLPASYILTPRWFHKVNVFMIRLTSFPILLLIAWYERQAKRTGTFTFYETVTAAADKVFDTLPRSIKRLTFFEGLSGPDADIEAIFELGDVEDNDLESDDDQGAYTSAIGPGRQRRLSTSSRLKVPVNAGPSATPTRSPVKSERAPGPSSIPLPRARVNTLLTRGQELGRDVASPLAQVFQPLVVEDDTLHDRHPSDNGLGSMMVSYGPASRRRLSSIQRRPFGTPQSVPNASPSAQQTAFRRFPTFSPPSQPAILEHMQPLSSSPDAKSGSEPLETAEEAEEQGTDMSVWETRLGNIESRQQRIEDLLTGLCKKLGA
ncbi:uncharacterized protein LAESUDRAFT_654224 [Laetiporus sulphureus 93-53]|uniref:Receptor-activated Ca2+-permeable cation channel n=1 Tax=Laetiporus sulphureus 93-53 TaxID=1314785 RepID=A0A165E394_9APHY|nr:uncharacterized protein LAESUDRAFT_654224 [Laetiporus sulphureus 93-53]KZT06157.1 hypothetical protein LAESUDRAFT_654224 [Laetiporus sulphureus 93-53]